jgi:hypothetical protein
MGRRATDLHENVVLLRNQVTRKRPLKAQLDRLGHIFE